MIRILIAQLPRLLRDLLAGTVSDQEDIVVVGESSDRESLPGLVGSCRPDVVIVGCEQSEISELGGELAAHHPAVRLLAITDDGRRGFLFQLRPWLADLGELTPGVLIAAIRQDQPPPRVWQEGQS